MTRPAAPSDFAVDVENLGTFIFGRRTRRDNFSIAAEYHRLTGGTNPANSEFGMEAEAQATVSHLVVAAPPGFLESIALDNPDPFEPEVSNDLIRTFLALRAKEFSFRLVAREAVEAARPRDGAGDGVLVPPKVQPAAD